jgi:hypothetical protein
MTRTFSLVKSEKYLFFIVALLNTIPLFSAIYFPTLDGASHLANANIIKQLIFHQNPLFGQFFAINPEPVPNWTSHLVLALLMIPFPAWMAEKILLVTIVVAFPVAFRRLLLSVAPDRPLMSYLIFPLSYSMFLNFGFYNFCISVIMLMFTLTFWIKHCNHPWSFRSFSLLTLLIAITYFSHILSFGVLLILIASHIVSELLSEKFISGRDWRAVINLFFRKSLIITGSALIPLILFIYFFLTRPGTRDLKFLPKDELWNYLITFRPLITFNPVSESKLTIWFTGLLAILAIVGFILLILRKLKMQNRLDQPAAENPGSRNPNLDAWWLTLSIGFLTILYFILPDAYGTASYTNLRILFILSVLFLVGLALLPGNKFAYTLALLAGISFTAIRLSTYRAFLQPIENIAGQCHGASKHIKPNTLVLPLYFMDNWFTGHFVDYFAVDKPVVMVYNYECESGYFPTIWNSRQRPNHTLGNPDDPDLFLNFEMNKGGQSMPLDYVFILGSFDTGKDWFLNTLTRILDSQYKMIYENGHARLFERIQPPVSGI